jgi:hypothetical protein
MPDGRVGSWSVWLEMTDCGCCVCCAGVQSSCVGGARATASVGRVGGAGGSVSELPGSDEVRC